MIPLCERTVIAGKYRLQRELAAGGMGAVWVARHLGLDEDVAVKFMSPSLPEQAEARERFAREARAAARVRGPHVVSVLDHGVDGDVPYLVMELLRGEHLGERLRRVGRLTLGATASIADQVARALTRAHRAGIVHRDLKPANVFLATLDDEEIVKVLDFGIAKQQGPGVADMTHNDVLMGSPQYMSPEQARGARDIDHRADLWSFGAILFRAVTGTPAFEGASAVDVIVRICAGPPPLPSRVSPRFAPELDAFFARALDRDPARRFGSAREMADAFAALSRSVADVMEDEEEEAHEELPETQPLGGTRADVTTAPPPPEEGAAPEGPHPEEGAAPSEQQMSLSPGLRAAGGRGSGSPEAAWRPGRGRIATAPEGPHPEEDIDAFVERAFGALVGADEGAAPTTSRSAELAPPPRQAPEVTVPLLRRLGAKPSDRPEAAARSGQRWLESGRPPLEGAVVTLIDQGFTALRRGEHETARRVWRAALGLDPSNRLLEANLRRLEAMGE